MQTTPFLNFNSFSPAFLRVKDTHSRASELSGTAMINMQVVKIWQSQTQHITMC